MSAGCRETGKRARTGSFRGVDAGMCGGWKMKSIFVVRSENKASRFADCAELRAASVIKPEELKAQQHVNDATSEQLEWIKEPSDTH